MVLNIAITQFTLLILKKNQLYLRISVQDEIQLARLLRKQEKKMEGDEDPIPQEWKELSCEKRGFLRGVGDEILRVGPILPYSYKILITPFIYHPPINEYKPLSPSFRPRLFSLFIYLYFRSQKPFGYRPKNPSCFVNTLNLIFPAMY